MSGLSFCGYAASNIADPSLVVPIDARLASLPPASHRPQCISRFLGWPWSEIFSEDGVERLLLDDSPIHSLTAVNMYDSFASEKDRSDLYLAMHARGMMEFGPAGAEILPVNGMFGVTKPSGAIRVIGELRRGNVPFISMEQLARVATRMIRERGGDDAPELRRKVLDLFNATALSSMPAGAVSKTECDMTDYFHYFLVPRAMAKRQRLAPIRASRVGVSQAEGGGMVVPSLTTLVMGMRFSSLIGQLIHERLLTPFLTRRVRFLLPGATAPSTLRAARALADSANVSGCVPLGSVPAQLLAPLLGVVAEAALIPPCPDVRVLPSGLPEVMAGFMVPAAIFLNELAPAGASPDSCFVRRGFDIREPDLSLALSEPPTDAVETADFLFMLYIDDHHDLIHGPVSESRPLSWLESVGNWSMLGSVISCVRTGLSVHQRKLVWASNVPSKTLGIVIDVRGPFTTFYPDAKKLEHLVQASWYLHRRAGRLVRVGDIVRATGSWVWGMLTRRLMLSIFQATYHWADKRSMSSWAPLPHAVAAEFLMALSMAPCCYGIAAPFAEKVMAFDASDSGYGVAYRRASRAVRHELSARIERHGSWTAFETSEAGEVGPMRRVNRLDPSMAQATAKWLLSGWGPGPMGWRIARAGAWRSPRKHITLGEIQASTIAGEHVASRPGQCRDVRTIFLGDNQASLGALSKGRSSNPAMNAVCRRWLALSVVAKIFPVWVYVRSKANPSDVASRMFLRSDGRTVRAPRPKLSRPASEWIEDLTTHGDVEHHPGPRSYWQGVRLKPEDIDFTGVLGLKLSSVKPDTAAGYITAIMAYKRWVVATGQTRTPLDVATARYVAWGYEYGEVSKGQITHLLCGIVKVCPRYKRLGVLDDAWGAMQGWTRLRPSKAYIPVLQHVVFGCAQELQQRGFTGAAVAILTGFDCYLRSMDMCCLQCCDVAFRGDPRLIDLNCLAAVCLRYTKAQRHQWVSVRCPLAVQGLRRLTAGRPGAASVFGLRSDQLLALFKKAQCWLGFLKPPHRTHSLRGGGATHDRIHRAISFLDIQLRGRWSGNKITLHYIQESQAMLLQLDFPEAVKLKILRLRQDLRSNVAIIDFGQPGARLSQ
jgi:hypothetical protein